MATRPRLKVLISAYACGPHRGSEPGVGWGFVQALAERHDLWVLVEEEKFRESIERHLREGSAGAPSNVRFVFIRKRRNRALRKLWPPSYYWFYREWHRSALDVARRLHEEVGFDLVHQLTMVGFREPGYLWTLDLPFVWGPIGGMGLFPWRFLGQVGVRGAVHYGAYNLFNLAQMRWSKRPRMAAQRAGAGLLFATAENRDGALRLWGCGGEVVSEVGLPPAHAEPVVPRSARTPLSLVWSGQHTPGKALNLGLQALARVPRDVEWTLDVLGRGSETARWVRTARRLGIWQRCRFHGFVERSKALGMMRSAHALLITSLRDLTSTVLVEALTLGVPVICPDHCGFSDAVDETCGIKVPVRSPRQLIPDMARAIEKLARDEPHRILLAEGALRRAQDFDWFVKAARVDEVYRHVLGSRERAAGTIGEST